MTIPLKLKDVKMGNIGLSAMNGITMNRKR